VGTQKKKKEFMASVDPCDDDYDGGGDGGGNTEANPRLEAWLQRLKEEQPDVYGDATVSTDLFPLMLEHGLYKRLAGYEEIRQKLCLLRELRKKEREKNEEKNEKKNEKQNGI
jgi:hypothetical protein